MTDHPPTPRPTLAARLSEVQLGMRQDLDVSRHLFRGQPSYIVRDPITFLTQRLDPADYDVFVRIEASKSLGAVFADLVAEGKADQGSEEAFYQFIMSLHGIGFLHLPVVDDKLLYRRHRAKVLSQRKQKFFGFMFLKIPLINPNAFLNRTVGRIRWLFGVRFFAVWLTVMLMAAGVITRRWSDLTEPLQGLLVAGNLPLMWATLVGLKVFHEFGHAYCCKHYGGHVPEMGAYLILFTPCAYMDATSSWGFRKRRHRVYVCLAGMYFESMIGAIAVFVWALTNPGFWHSAAYNVIFLSTVVTVGFNVNPLMRYDGYYILSDLVEIPNLRARATAYVTAVLKRIVFGIPSSGPLKNWREKATLLTYGLAASVYRILLVLGISAVLASKVFLLGMVLAVAYVGSTAYGIITKLVRYLWHAEETAHARLRGAVIGVTVLLLAPAALFLIPVPSSVKARCIVVAEHETTAHAREPGFLRRNMLSPNQHVQRGSIIAELVNDDHVEQVATAASGLKAAEILVDAYRVLDPTMLAKTEVELNMHRDALELAESRASGMTLRAPCSGRVVECITGRDLGRFMQAGEPVATIVSGAWRLHTVLNEGQVADVDPTVGDHVSFRPFAATRRIFEGVVTGVSPAGSRTIRLPGLTHLAGGDIAVNPRDGMAAEPYFEVTVELNPSDSNVLRYGMAGILRMKAKPKPIGVRITRRIATFVNKLLRD